MVAIDWLGVALSVAITAPLLKGRWRLPRAMLALVLCETSRLVLFLALAGEIYSVSVSGVFGQGVVGEPVHPGAVYGGVWCGLAFALCFGRKTVRDSLVYALLSNLGLMAVRG